MKSPMTTVLAGALALGAAVCITMPASAAPVQQEGASSLLLVASSGWAARVSGHRSTYGAPYGYDEGYDGYAPYRSAHPYGTQPYAYGAPPVSGYYGNENGYDAY